MRRLRQQTVVKLTPIRHYSPIEIHKSTKPLTTPHSPNIGEKRKRLEGAGYGMRSYHSAYDPRAEAEESGLEDHHEVDGYGHPIEPQHHRPQAPTSAKKPMTPQQRLSNFEQRRSIQQPVSATNTTSSQSSIAITMASPPKRPIAMPASMRRTSREITSSSSDSYSTQQQNRVRAEIERQRAKDLAYTPPSNTVSLEQRLQEIQEQHESQMLREKKELQQQAEGMVTVASSLDVPLSSASRYYKRSRPSSRPSEVIIDSASEREDQNPLPPIRRPMGRKSWLEANDL